MGKAKAGAGGPKAGEPPLQGGGEGPPPLALELLWVGDFRFEARGRGAAVRLDGDGEAGISPMETLLAALGSCAATDIVDILRKGRQPPRSLSLRLRGERRKEIPRRFIRILAEVRIGGAIERAKAERAVELAFEKYCSVRATLDPALPIETSLLLEA